MRHWHYFYFTGRNDQTRQRLIYNDIMQRLIPIQSRGLVRIPESRIQRNSGFNVNAGREIVI